MKLSDPAAQENQGRYYETDSGAYQLIFRLEHDVTVAVGALGSCRFLRGTYIYTGRASRGLGKRIERHLRKEKRLRWHIDYVLQQARVEEILVYPGKAAEECVINDETALVLKGIFPVKGFGSSDCKCTAHLQFIPEMKVSALDAWTSELRSQSPEAIMITSFSVET